MLKKLKNFCTRSLFDSQLGNFKDNKSLPMAALTLSPVTENYAQSKIRK